MKKLNVSDILKRLSLMVINFEAGDILMLSDMLDDVILLKSQLDKKENILLVLNKIETLLNDLLKGEPCEGFSDILSDGIDLISELVLNTDDNKKQIVDVNLNNFLENPSEAPEDKNSLDVNYDLNSDTIKIFLVEADERISTAQEIILELEKDLDNKKIIDELFRVFHTIKGECGFLNLIKLGEVTHELENLLDMLRYSEIENNIDIIDIIFDGVDVIAKLLSALNNCDHNEYNSIEIKSIIEKIEHCTTNVRIPLGQVLKEEGLLNEEQVQDIAHEQKDSGYVKKFGEIATEKKIISEQALTDTLKKQRQIQTKSDTFVKVSVSQVNYLVDMIGELLIAENQLQDENIEFLHKITKEIQQTAIMLRTVKIKNLLINMKRVVRDASKKLNKQVVLEIEGEDLEVDRNLVESLEEPLIHILRNAVGHGIESREDRSESGKSEHGTILIRAERVGNHIKITIRDDGQGLNTKKIVEKAVSKNIISPEKSRTLKIDEIYSLIFAPGFSTSEVVDKVSGRGVGMDIVKTRVNSLRGNIDIKSEEGKYSEFILEFPLIMAIIDSMIILVDDVNYIIPVVNVIETVKYEKQNVHNIEKSKAVIGLRDEIIPVIDLRTFFNMNDSDRPLIELAIIIELNKKKHAFIVDQIVTKKEVVIKSLGDRIGDVRGISAATILGGGKIGYIINIDEVVNG